MPRKAADYAKDDIKRVLLNNEEPIMSTKEVTKQVDIAKRTTLSKLQELHEDNEIGARNFESRFSVWYHPDRMKTVEEIEQKGEYLEEAQQIDVRIHNIKDELLSLERKRYIELPVQYPEANDGNNLFADGDPEQTKQLFEERQKINRRIKELEEAIESLKQEKFAELPLRYPLAF